MTHGRAEPREGFRSDRGDPPRDAIAVGLREILDDRHLHVARLTAGERVDGIQITERIERLRREKQRDLADRAHAGGGGERPVHPMRFVAMDEIPSGEIARREVVVTGDRDERAFQSPGHVFDEARLPAPRRPFEHHGKFARVTRGEDVDLVAGGKVERLGWKAANAVVERAVARRRNGMRNSVGYRRHENGRLRVVA